MNYFIGIDGGGTKTDFLCIDENGVAAGKTTLSTVHIMQVDDGEAVRILKQGIEETLPETAAKKDVFICAGFGGYGKNAEIRQRIETICSNSFGNMNFSVKNDGEIALYGALNGEDGILIIAGTGTIGLAKVKDEMKRCGGWGYLLGDEGSAYWIGKKLLGEFCRQSDGRSQKTKLFYTLLEHFGLEDSYNLIPIITQTHDRTSVASLAKLAFALAEEKDSAALEIYEEAAKQLADIVNALSKNYPDGCKLSYAGGVWRAGEYIIAPLKKYLDEKIQLIAPEHTPVYGAYLLARKMSKKGCLGTDGRILGC